MYVLAMLGVTVQYWQPFTCIWHSQSHYFTLALGAALEQVHTISYNSVSTLHTSLSQPHLHRTFTTSRIVVPFLH